MPWDDRLTDDKKDIIRNNARIKVIKAGPGSGKTTLFVAAIQKTLGEWQHKKSGIAALSYTRVAQQEIYERAGHIPPPHTITTIDGFILRHIIKPFAHLITQSNRGTRLLPAPIAEQFGDDMQVGATNTERDHVTNVTFSHRDEHNNIVLRARIGHQTHTIPQGQVNAVLRAKRRLWRNGLVTHSDTHYLAYELLHHPQHGTRIAKIVTQRFPTILIDEFQDTNYFLAHAMRQLLAEPTVTGIVVGDPDQAIYEFGGANPRLFDDITAIPGAQAFPLRTTHRCPRRVAVLAAQLAESEIQPTLDEGTTQLVTHNDNVQTLHERIVAMSHAGDRVAIIARKAKTITTIQGHITRTFPGGCRLAARLSEAADALPTNPSKARQITSAALAKMTLDDEHPTKQRLEAEGISPATWRRATWHVLRTAASTTEGETWREWVLKLKPAFKEAADMINKPLEQAAINRALQTRNTMNSQRTRQQPAPMYNWPANTRFDTVHGVKGEEFDVVALYCPKPDNRPQNKCISEQWWNPQETEERRVAYVATTRAKRTFILCVHERTSNALRQSQARFYGAFEQTLPETGEIRSM